MNIIKLAFTIALSTYGLIGAIQQRHSDTGAGVVLLEDYFNGKKREPAIIIFKDRFTGKFTDAGGRREKKEDLRLTAARELKEESCNTFRINAFKTKMLNDFNAIRHHSYVCYFMRVCGPTNKQLAIYSAFYRHNQKLLSSGTAPHSFKETNGMTRIFLSQLIKDKIQNSQGDFVTRDAQGNRVTITARTSACLREALRLKMIQNIYAAGPTILKENAQYRSQSGQQFLNGTKCYWS